MVKLAVFPKGFFDELVSGRMSLEEWIDLAATLDVDGVEMYPAFFQRQDDAYIDEIRRRISDHGLEMPMLCHSPDFTHPDPAWRANQVLLLKERIALTAKLGGTYCRVLSGQRRPEVSEKDGVRWVVECLEQALPFAEEMGIRLTLENHYKDGMWTQPEFAQAGRLFLQILEAIPSPWLAVQYDPSNAVVAGEDPYALLHAVGRAAWPRSTLPTGTWPEARWMI